MASAHDSPPVKSGVQEQILVLETLGLSSNRSEIGIEAESWRGQTFIYIKAMTSPALGVETSDMVSDEAP